MLNKMNKYRYSYVTTERKAVKEKGNYRKLEVPTEQKQHRPEPGSMLIGRKTHYDFIIPRHGSHCKWQYGCN